MLSTNFVFDRRKEEKKKGRGNIELRIYLSGKEAYHKSSVWLKSNQWDQNKSRVKNHPDSVNANLYLRSLRTKAEQFYLEKKNAGKMITAREIKRFLDQKPDHRSDFISFFRAELERSRTTLAASTIKQHRTLLDRYLSPMGMIPFESMDYSWLKDFEYRLLSTISKKTKQPLSRNYVSSLLRIMGQYIKEAIKQGRMKQNPFLLFEIQKEETDKPYLTFQEVQWIEEADLPEGRFQKIRASKARFLFSMYSGLRFSDTNDLRKKHFQEAAKGLLLLKKQIKTDRYGNLINLPLWDLFHGKPEKLIREWIAGKNPDDLIFGTIDNKTYNDHLKAIAQKAGIEKKVTSHVARHTCAMILLNEFRLPKHYVQGVLGHSSITTTEIYSKLEYSALEDAISEAFK